MNWYKLDKLVSGTIKDEFLSFEYIKQPIKEEETLKWRKQGYYHKSFSGSMYSSKNPMPDWVNDVADQVGLDNCGFVFYRMDQLDIMPPHIDHFETYCRIFDINRNDVFRAIVFLQDWQPGHYFEYDGNGLVNWKKGDYVIYSTNTLHAASNIGVKPRYTLQVTGIKKNK
mgnify:FL=1|tara:strand:+ start:414 stop:923 length:510 start_codon:yes stop_codon:yes gene_type:complete